MSNHDTPAAHAATQLQTPPQETSSESSAPSMKPEPSWWPFPEFPRKPARIRVEHTDEEALF